MTDQWKPLILDLLRRSGDGHLSFSYLMTHLLPYPTGFERDDFFLRIAELVVENRVTYDNTSGDDLIVQLSILDTIASIPSD